MKKVIIVLIACMFLIGVLPAIVGEEAEDYTLRERKYKEDRDIIPIYTKNGLVNVPAKGKPVYYMTITSPTGEFDLSGTVTITIDANTLPSVYIDGVFLAKGYSVDWDTTAYSDGAHIIYAEGKGVDDEVTVTVDNGGGPVNQPPTVTIDYPDHGSTVYGIIEILVTADDPEDGPLDAIIKIDGVQKAVGDSYIWDTTLYSDGSHTILAEAEDGEGEGASDSNTVTVANGGGDINRYALCIGISNYDGDQNDLNYCDDDARDWESFLRGEGYSVKTLIDGQATADNIVAEIEDLLALEDGDDYVVLTYSGHGLKNQYGSCIISRDLFYITHGYIEQLFDSVDSQHIFFTFDACQIGGFQGLVDNNGVGAFASNRRYSYDGIGGIENGIFTYYQLEGWSAQGFDNFEDDSAYAVAEMEAWASQYRIRVDPFYVDEFVGPMLP